MQSKYNAAIMFEGESESMVFESAAPISTPEQAAEALRLAEIERCGDADALGTLTRAARNEDGSFELAYAVQVGMRVMDVGVVITPA